MRFIKSKQSALLKQADKLARAQEQLERFCAYQERSLHEVEQKLRKIDLSPREQQELIAYLREENFLNEERFARAFVRGKFRIKLWGRKKIAAELYRHKVGSGIIEAALDAEIAPEAYLENIHHLIRRKQATLPVDLEGFVLRTKLLNYLAQKGYETDLILQALPEVLPE